VAPKQKTGYLPSLDGWRAFAILLVIMQHDQQWRLFGISNAKVRDFGGFGVSLFFAISGILICWRILEDEAAQGTFHLRAFYIRRIFRIQPAAWAYLLFIALLILFGIVHERWHFWLGAFLLYQNFTWHQLDFNRMLGENWFTGHFWTLAVEEHFYILLSLFLFLCRRYRIAILGLFLAALCLVQNWAITHGHFSQDVSTRRTYWQIQFLLVPALLAMILRVPTMYRLAVKYLRPWVAFAVTASLIYGPQVFRNGLHGLRNPVIVFAHTSTLFYCFGLWVAATMLHPASVTTRFLELKPLRYLGRLSYSVYLWHVLFFSTTLPYAGITWPPLVFAGQRPWRYIFALGAAMLSYHLLEKPLMRLGHKLAPPATAGHADLGAATVTPASVPEYEAAVP
jgi:peptidoglycan/LPS O-acetylase OafA/YrhL